MAPTWALLLECQPMGIEQDIIEDTGIFQKVIQEHRKPNRPCSRNEESDYWMLHTTTSWTERHLEQDKEVVKDKIVQAFSELVQKAVLVKRVQLHRWRYAQVSKGIKEEFWANSEQTLFCAGDTFGFDPEHNGNLGLQRAFIKRWLQLYFENTQTEKRKDRQSLNLKIVFNATGALMLASLNPCGSLLLVRIVVLLKS